jgi:hypothetical protein
LTQTPFQRQLRQVLSDAFAFVRSQEINKAINDLSFDDLIEVHIRRNGETNLSAAKRLDPYGFDPDAPSSARPLEEPGVGFLSGTDLSAPTKLDRVLSLKNAIKDTVDAIKDSSFRDDMLFEDTFDDVTDDDLFDAVERLENS